MSSFSDEYRRILSIYQNDKTVNEICKANGISKTKFVNSYDKIEKIEIFMGKFKSLRSLIYFPGLVKLTVIKHEIHRIEGLNNCVNLMYLYLHENRIRKISGLDHLPMLKGLYLYSNEIEKIEGLDNLPRLEVLWLSENRISVIENLGKLKRLTELNLGRNRIEHIGSNLSELPNLEELNLSGNRIGQFKEIPPLNNVRTLRVLQLKSTMYGENPICSLCNYQTYVIYHLRQIKELDQVQIGEQARHMAEATFLKKKMYYNMRIKTLKRNIFMVERRAEEMLNMKVNHLRLNLNILTRSRKELERELEEIRYCSPWNIEESTKESSGGGSKSDSEQDEEVEGELEERYSRHEMKLKLARTKEYIRKLKNLIELIQRRFKFFQESLCSHTIEQIRKFLVELQTGGNIRIEEGKPGDVWFQSCIDLVKSRFHPRDFDPYFGIKTIKVNRVLKIHNRFLRNRFEEHLESIVDISDKSYKRSMEYLFFHSSLCPISNPYSSTCPITTNRKLGEVPLSSSTNVSSQGSTAVSSATNSPIGFSGAGGNGGSVVVPITSEKVEEKNLQHIYHVIEDGFPNTKVYQDFGMNSAISVSNSLSVISIPRLSKIRATKGKNYLNILLSSSLFSLVNSRRSSSSSTSTTNASSSISSSNNPLSTSLSSSSVEEEQQASSKGLGRTGGRGKKLGDGDRLLFKNPSSIMKGRLLIAKVFLGQYARESLHSSYNSNNNMDEEEQQRNIQQQMSQYSGRVMYRKVRKVSSLSRSAVMKRMNKKLYNNNSEKNKNNENEKNGLKITPATFEKKGDVNINGGGGSSNGSSNPFFRSSSSSTRKRISSGTSNSAPNNSSGKSLIHKKYYKNCDSVYRPAGGSGSKDDMKDGSGGTVGNSSSSSSNSGSSGSSSKQKLWFVFDYRMLVPEYLVEFEYQSSSMSMSHSSKQSVMKNIMKSMNMNFRETNNNNNNNNSNNFGPKGYEEKGGDEIMKSSSSSSNSKSKNQSSQQQRKKRQGRRKYASSKNQNNKNIKSSGYNPQMQQKQRGGYQNRPNGKSHRKGSSSTSGGGSSSSSSGSSSKNTTVLGGSHTRFKKISSEFNFLMSQFHNSRFTHIDLNDLYLVSVAFFKFAHFLHIKVPPPKKVYEETKATPSSNEGNNISEKPAIYSGKISRVLNLPPKIQPRKSFPKRITYEDVRMICRTEKITSVTYLNLFNQKISSLEGLSGLVHLRILKLGFNEITSVKDFRAFEFLDTLDLSYNLIKRLDGLEGFKLKKLKRLELNNNLLFRFDDVEIIRMSFPKIERLSLACNQICKVKNYRHLVIRKLQSSLKVLDDKSIGEHEKRKAVRLSIFVTNKLLKKHAVFTKDYSVHLEDFPNLPPFHAYNFNANNEGKTRQNNNDFFVTGTTVDPFRYFSHTHPYTSTRPSQPIDDSPGWEKKLEEIDFSDLDLRRMKKLRPLGSLRKLSFARNSISRIEGLSECGNLQELNLEGNNIMRIEGLCTLIHLRKLHIGNNRLKMLENVEYLIRLTELSIENNQIESLKGISKLVSLMEFYCSHNKLEEIKEVHHLRTLSKLIILDLSFNGLCKEENYRLYVIYNLRKLKVLDGLSIDSNEMGKAKQEFSGKLTLDLLQERLGHTKYGGMTELDLSGLSLKVLHPHLSQNFPILEELSLDNNNLSTIYGLSGLSKLVVLNLNNNKIEVNSNTRSVSFGRYIDQLMLLEQLSLDNNIIESMIYLQLHKLPRLRVLSLRSNKIHRIEGLTGLRRLEELLLDKNKLKYIDDRAFQDTPNLRLLHLEENSIRYLSSTMSNLHQLRSLYMSCNRIIDLNEFEKLSGLEHLEEVVFSFNPISRKSLYRATLIFKIPTLRFVDGKEIGEDERERAEIFFSQDYFSGMTGGSGGQGMMQQYHQYVSRSNRNHTSTNESSIIMNKNTTDESKVSRTNPGSLPSGVASGVSNESLVSTAERKLLLNQKIKVNNMQLEYLNLDGTVQPVDNQVMKGYSSSSVNNNETDYSVLTNKRRISKQQQQSQQQQQQQQTQQKSIISDLFLSKKRSASSMKNSTSSSSQVNPISRMSTNKHRYSSTGNGGGGGSGSSNKISSKYYNDRSTNSGGFYGVGSSRKKYSSSSGGTPSSARENNMKGSGGGGLYKGSYSSRGFLRNNEQIKEGGVSSNSRGSTGGSGSTKYHHNTGYRRSGGHNRKKVTRITQLHFPRFGSKK